MRPARSRWPACLSAPCWPCTPHPGQRASCQPPRGQAGACCSTRTTATRSRALDDRLDRALATGLPVAIEQDLVWYRDPATGLSTSIVSHGEPYSGKEPSLEEHFFEHVRLPVERALRENQPERWPLIVLNLDLKTNEPSTMRRSGAPSAGTNRG